MMQRNFEQLRELHNDGHHVSVFEQLDNYYCVIDGLVHTINPSVYSRWRHFESKLIKHTFDDISPQPPIHTKESHFFLDELKKLTKEEIIEVVLMFFDQTDKGVKIDEGVSDGGYMVNEFGRVRRTLLNRLKIMVSNQVGLQKNKD